MLALGGLACGVFVLAALPGGNGQGDTATAAVASACADQTWPYLTAECLAGAKERSVRVLPPLTQARTTMMVMPVPEPAAQPQPAPPAVSASRTKTRHARTRRRPDPRNDYASSRDDRRTYSARPEWQRNWSW